MLKNDDQKEETKRYFICEKCGKNYAIEMMEGFNNRCNCGGRLRKATRNERLIITKK
jgi:PHP family Zn ribbon phosphoesterase